MDAASLLLGLLLGALLATAVTLGVVAMRARSAPASDGLEPVHESLDHLSLALGSLADLRAAATRLDEAGVVHGQVAELDGLGLAILSVQDPDDINLELSAPV